MWAYHTSFMYVDVGWCGAIKSPTASWQSKHVGKHLPILVVMKLRLLLDSRQSQPWLAQHMKQHGGSCQAGIFHLSFRLANIMTQARHKPKCRTQFATKAMPQAFVSASFSGSMPNSSGPKVTWRSWRPHVACSFFMLLQETASYFQSTKRQKGKDREHTAKMLSRLEWHGSNAIHQEIQPSVKHLAAKHSKPLLSTDRASPYN